VRIALTHLRHARTGGTERFLDGLAGHLARAGHTITIVCRSHAAPPHPAVRFERLRGFALGGAWRTRAFASAVASHVERTPYDLVVGLGRTTTQDALRLGGGCQETYLELAHEATLTPRERLLGGGAWKHRLAVKLEREAMAAGAHVIVNSEMVRRDVLRRYALPEERLTTIHNGVDLERFHPRHRADAGLAKRRELGLEPGSPAVLFLGTGYARKGLDLVLEAFVRVHARVPSARLLVAGFDSDGARYEAEARALGLASVTRFLGGTLAPEELYAAADLYVLPTRYDPFANSTLEALASGLPTLTSRTNGGGELLTPGREGEVLTVADGAAPLAEALVRWCEPELRSAGARAARALAEQHGQEAKFAQAEALFARLAQARGPLATVGAR